MWIRFLSTMQQLIDIKDFKSIRVSDIFQLAGSISSSWLEYQMAARCNFQFICPIKVFQGIRISDTLEANLRNFQSICPIKVLPSRLPEFLIPWRLRNCNSLPNCPTNVFKVSEVSVTFYRLLYAIFSFPRYQKLYVLYL